MWNYRHKSPEYLSYGCEISLSQQENGYVSASGFIDSLLYLKTTENDLDFSQCLFRVFPFCIHDLQNELLSSLDHDTLHEYQAKYSENSDSLDGEILGNLQKYEKLKGQNIRFGSIVYLQHVESSKFLTVMPNDTGILEKDSLKVCLSDFPNDYSCVKLEPTYNFQKEGGGFIRINDIVVLEIYLPALHKPAYINTSGKEFNKDTPDIPLDVLGKEINASLEKKLKWRINLYIVEEDSYRKNLRYNELFWVSHIEGGVVFTAFQEDLNSIMYFSHIVTDSNGLWKIESADKLTGGVVSTEEKFRLKHLASGLYLSIDCLGGSDKYFGKLALLNDGNNLWRFESIYNWEKQSLLEVDHFFYLINDNTGLRLHGVDDSDHLAHTRLEFSESTGESSYFKIYKANPTPLWEIRFTINSLQAVQKYYKFISSMGNGIEKDLISIAKAMRKRTEVVNEALEKMIDFLEHKLKSSFSIGKSYGQVDSFRQKVFREIQVIDALAQVLDKAFVGEFSLHKLLQADKFDKKNEKTKDINNNMIIIVIKDLSSTVKKIYRLISTTCQDNYQNQVYTFKFFPIFQKHAGYDLGATACMKVILKNNETLLGNLHRKSSSLQMSQKTDSVIDHYVWLLRKFHKERKQHLVEFLAEICKCNDSGITVNQEKVHEKLFLNPETYSKAVIGTSMDSDKKTLYVILQHPSGIGEENVDLFSCFENGIIKNYHIEIEYFTTLLGLFASLCKGRNYMSKSSINRWFPVHLLMNNIWNEEISIEIRAYFLQMLMNMHVDFEPRAYVKKPELVRTLDNSTNIETIFSQRHSIKSSNASIDYVLKRIKGNLRLKDVQESSVKRKRSKLAKHNDYILVDEEEIPLFNLKCELIDYFSSGNKPIFNVFMLEILKMVNMMVGFEVISIECSNYNEKKALHNPKSREFRDDEMDIIRLLQGVIRVLFFDKRDLRVSPFNLHKASITDLMKSNSGIGREKEKKDEDLGITSNSDDPFRRFSEGLEYFLSYHMSRSIDNSEMENIEIQCKLQLCDLLFYGLDLRQDFLISNILDWFKMHLPIEKSEVLKLIPPIANIQENFLGQESCFKNFHRPYIAPLNEINTDIIEDMMKLFLSTKNYKLQTKILGISLRLFNQRKEMIKNLHKLNIMPQDDDSKCWLWAKIEVSSLKNYSEQAEIICSYFKQNDYTASQTEIKLQNIKKILNGFEDLMYEETVNENFESLGQKLLSSDRQIMLRMLNFHTHLLKFINEGFQIFEEIHDDPKNFKEQTAREALKELFIKTFSVLTIYVTKNSKNQLVVYESLEIILKTLRVKVGQIDLICEIFRNNSDLCEKINEKLLNVFVNLILTEGRQKMFLKFFDVVLCLGNEPVPMLQRMILSQLVQSKDSDVLMFMRENRFIFDSNLVELEQKVDEPYFYHQVLIKVLGKCGKCNSAFKLNRIKCQKLIPVEYIFELLMKTGPFTDLHPSLLAFYSHVYVDDKMYLESGDTSYLGEYLQSLTDKIDSSEDPSFTEEFIESLIECLFGFKKCPTDSPNYEKICPTIKNFLQTLSGRISIIKNIPISSASHHTLQSLAEFNGIELPELNSALENHVNSTEFLNKSAEKSRWEQLKKFMASAEISKLVKNEQFGFLEVFKNIEKMSHGINEMDMIQGMLEYISLSLIHRPPNDILFSVIEFLGYKLVKPEIKDNEDEAKAKRRVQNQFKEIGAVQVVLNLMCDNSIDKSIFGILVHFSTELLSGGNEKIQQDFFDFFLSFQSSEDFFHTIYNLISDFTIKTSNISDTESKYSSKFKKSRKLINNIIKLLQLFCENHYEKLQNYIRNQEKSRNNYDLVRAVIVLLNALMLKKKVEYFHIISNCFEMLTECIQGPCKANQKAIINSKFLELSNELLSLDEKSSCISYYNGMSSTYANESSNEGDMLKGWMIAHLKYKCLITLIALLEGRTDNYVIIRMVRAFSIQLFKQNLISVYSTYVDLYPERLYNRMLFNHFEGNDKYKFNSNDNPQDKKPKEFTMIIETGFMIFHLLSYFNLIDDPEIKRAITSEFPQLVNQKVNINRGILNNLGNFGKGIFKAGYTAVKMIGRVVPAGINQDQLLNNAILFFQQNTGNIEIIFKNTIYKTYFWLPPVCKYLTVEAKTEFHRRVDRSSEKSKIEYLVNNSYLLIEDMQYEEKLSKLFGYRFMTGFITPCKIIVFILTLYLNILILISYSIFNPDNDRLNSPSYLNIELTSNHYKENKETIEHIQAVGIAHCFFSGAIFIYFTVKTAPLLVQREWKLQQKTLDMTEVQRKFKRMIIRCNMVLKTIALTLSKVDVIYQMCFFTFSVLALSVHPFFFSIHLLDILYRDPSLQSVVMSVVLPWRSLVLTLVLIIIIVYLFSIWGYVQFYKDFYLTCDSLLMCFRTTFDQGFKNSGGIGMWLDYMPGYSGEVTPKDLIIPRFFYDDLFMIIIVIIMLNIVLGLIIDTFAVLRENDEVSIKDREKKCFICGKEKEEIERLTRQPFRMHTLTEHNEWNYLFFIAYLEFKEKTEHNGTDSYIKQLVDARDVEWIPQQRGLSFDNAS